MLTRHQLLPILFGISVSLLIPLARANMAKYYWSRFMETTGICNTEECKEYGKFLNTIINPSINPCVDFYEYVCSGWVKKNPLPPYYEEWSIDSQMQLDALHHVQEFLNEPILQRDGSDLIKAKKFHHECMKISNYCIVDPTLIRVDVKTVGYFPLINILKSRDKSWQMVHNYYLSLTGESALFSIFLYSDRRANDEPRIYLREILSPFGLIKGDVVTNTQMEKYVQFLITLTKTVFPNETYYVNQGNLEKRIFEVLTFRLKLYNIKTKTAQASNLFHPISVADMNDRYKELTRNRRDVTKIDWVKTIQIFRKHKETRKAVKRVTINLQNRVYFQLLAELLDKVPEDVIVNHVHLYFIERYTSLDTRLRKMLMDVVIQDGKLKGKVRYLSNKLVMCVMSNPMKETIGRQYVKRQFSQEKKYHSQALATELKEMLKVQINESTWLDSRTTDVFRNKLDDMTIVIGYPQYYDDPSKKNKGLIVASFDPITMDSYYLPNSNFLVVSAADVNEPIFDPLLPYAITYSGLGEYIAHEMYHAFGIAANQHDKRKLSWPKSLKDAYAERISCFIKKFNKLPVQELKNMQPAPVIDGYETVEENLSDLMGLKLAYWTFRKKVWDKKKCESLPYLPNFSCDQLFFVSFASTFCTTLTVDTFVSHLNKGTHATPRLRVNEATSNFEIFNQVFQCAKNKKTARPNTCDLWE